MLLSKHPRVPPWRATRGRARRERKSTGACLDRNIAESKPGTGFYSGGIKTGFRFLFAEKN